MIEIRIFGKEDRLKVAAILIENGYCVKQISRSRTGTKSLDYLLLAEDVREDKPQKGVKE
jgi:hypothetical protein